MLSQPCVSFILDLHTAASHPAPGTAAPDALEVAAFGSCSQSPPWACMQPPLCNLFRRPRPHSSASRRTWPSVRLLPSLDWELPGTGKVVWAHTKYSQDICGWNVSPARHALGGSNGVQPPFPFLLGPPYLMEHLVYEKNPEKWLFRVNERWVWSPCELRVELGGSVSGYR